MMRELRPHQDRALTMLRQSLGSGKRRPMLCAPTGAGKTLLAAKIVEGALVKGNRVTFCVPALSLIDQTVEAFWAEGIRDVGVIQAAHSMTNALRPVQIASVQTLQRRSLPRSEVVVIDEAHRWFELYGAWMRDPDWARVPFIGLSATPWTRGLGKYFDDLLVPTTTAELIESGYLSPFRVYAPAHPDMKGVRTVAGDYHEGDLSAAMDKPTLIADIVDTWRQRGEDRPTLCFAVDRAHAKNIQKQFEASGIPTGYIDAYTDQDERKDIERRFHAGEVKVVCNVGCLTTGVDWDVRCIILARPTKSEMLFVQIIGRGLRLAHGKDDCLVLDHSDTHLRLGMVTDIAYAELDDGKPRDKAKTREARAALPKECPKCTFVKPAKVRICPSCGFVPEASTKIECEAGDLVQIAGRKSKPKATTQERQRWYSMLLHVAVQRGYKRGWAANKFREKFGAFPRNLSERPQPATQDVLRYVKHSMIRFAASKAATDEHAA